MLRISRMSDYSIVLLTDLACQSGQPVTARELAGRTGLGLATVGKLLKSLAQQGLLESIQGRHGGYRLAHEPGEISLAQIIEAVDGPIAMTDCDRTDADCDRQSSCTTRAHWQVINQAIRRLLTRTSLADMCRAPEFVPVWHETAGTRTGQIHENDCAL
ncbi:MAG: SUF system Fe-S cluster assembly regulator [Halothiobacillaceae bacterium]